MSGTTWVGQYQKNHSPTQTHPDNQTPSINFFHLLRSTASNLFNLRAWQSFSTTSPQVLFDGGVNKLEWNYVTVTLCINFNIKPVAQWHSISKIQFTKGDFPIKMHRNRYWRGIYPGPCWRSYSAPLGLKSSTSHSVHFFIQSLSSFRNTCPYPYYPSMNTILTHGTITRKCSSYPWWFLLWKEWRFS